MGRVANQLPPPPPERKFCSSAENLENIYQSVTARKHSRGGSFERAAVHLGKTSCEWEKVWQEPPPPFGEIAYCALKGLSEIPFQGPIPRLANATP